MRGLRSRGTRRVAQSKRALPLRSKVEPKTQKHLQRCFFGSINAWLARLQYKKDLQSNHFPTKQYNSYKKQHSSDLSAGAVFVSIRVLLFGKIVLCLPLVHRCLPHRAIAPFVEQFPQKERAVAILTFF